MTDKQVNLHPKNATSVNLKPNIITENIPDKAVTLEKLDQNLQETIRIHGVHIDNNRADINANTDEIEKMQDSLNTGTFDPTSDNPASQKSTYNAIIPVTLEKLDQNLQETIRIHGVHIDNNRADINANTDEIEKMEDSLNTGTFDPTSDNPAGQKSTAEALISKDEYYSTYALYRFADVTFIHHYEFNDAIKSFLNATCIDGMFSGARFVWQNIMLTIPSFKSRITSCFKAFAFADDSHVVSLTFKDNYFRGHGLFSEAGSLTSVVVADGSNVKIFGESDYCFLRCKNLVEIGAFDLSEVTSLNESFNSNKLKHIHIKNFPVSFDISASTQFEEADLVEIIGNLVDLTGKTAQTLTMGATNLGKLTDAEKAVATNKNWTLA